MTDGDLYSPEAEAQLDALEAGPDEALYNAILDAIERVLDFPDLERGKSPGLRDSAGRPLFSTVVMYERDPRWFVFWNASDGVIRILGVGALPLP